LIVQFDKKRKTHDGQRMSGKQSSTGGSKHEGEEDILEFR